MTRYKVVYELANRVKTIEIWAASPMLAFKKWKEMMPEIIYKNSSVHSVNEVEDKKRNRTVKICHPTYFTVTKAI